MFTLIFFCYYDFSIRFYSLHTRKKCTYINHSKFSFTIIQNFSHFSIQFPPKYYQHLLKKLTYYFSSSKTFFLKLNPQETFMESNKMWWWDSSALLLTQPTHITSHLFFPFFPFVLTSLNCSHKKKYLYKVVSTT